ncbi:MAG: hypothetical protein JSR26_05215 [Proteobacteria bacterium]|nr:hypothetical protein [Pseudomonadota bacterium]
MPQASSPYHALPWQRPAGQTWIAPVERAIEKLARAQEGQFPALRQAIAGKQVPVFRADGVARRRGLRSDGLTNLITLMTTLVAYSDLRSGLVAAPVDDRARWERKTWGQVDWRAYGELVPDERSQRRTERWARVLVDLGYIRTVEWKKPTKDGDWRSLPGLKFVTMKFWKLIGMAGAIAAIRRQHDRQRGQERVAQFDRQFGRRKQPAKATPAAVPATPAAHPPERPPSQAGPPASAEVAQANIREILKTLSKRS